MSIKGFKVGAGNTEQYDYNYLDNKPSNLVQDANYVHTDNNFSNSYKTKLNGIENQANKTVVDASLSSSSTNPVQNKVVKAALDNKAEIDGYYEDLTSGNAEQLVATVGVTDKVPYNFRTSGGAADIGNRETDKLVGGTIAWNQFFGPVNSTTINNSAPGSGGSYSFSDGVCTFQVSIRYGYVGANVSLIVGHKYLLSCEMKTTSATNGVAMAVYRASKSKNTVEKTDWQSLSMVFNSVQVNEVIMFSDQRSAGFDPVQFKEVMLIDLTQMFGSAVADYIYSLEQANAGAGVAWFRKLFPKPYYAYNAGQLLSVKASAHDMVGFNQWDEEWEVGDISQTGQPTSATDRIRSKNFISVMPNTTYYLCSPAVNARIITYDGNKDLVEYYSSGLNNTTFTTGANVHYIKFYMFPAYGTTYKHDICINLSWSGYRNGEYEPYVKHTYALDSDLELRGVPKLGADNRLYYDGDTYASDGTVTRKYGIVDLGTLDWIRTTSYANPFFFSAIPDRVKGQYIDDLYVCPLYSKDLENRHSGNFGNYAANMSITMADDANSIQIFVRNDSYSTDVAFESAMSGVYLVYELATPTTETADPYQNPQIVDDFGTEEYVDTRDVPVPVGHDTFYQANLRDKLQNAPDSPNANGDYIMRRTANGNAYVPLPSAFPAAPSTDGTYVLKATVSGGTTTLAWVAE